MEPLHGELYFKIAESKLELQSCYHMRYSVDYQNKRHLHVNEFLKSRETGPYDEKAANIIAYDEDFKPVGTMRILKEEDFVKLPFCGHPGLKGKQLNIPKMAELSELIIDSEKNRYYILKGLIRIAYQTSRKLGIDNWIFVSGPGLIRHLRTYSFYFNPIGTPSKYNGGFTLASWCDIRQNEDIWKRQDLEAWRFNSAEPVIMTPNSILV